MSPRQNLQPQYPFTPTKIQALRSLQELLVRLYFCDRLQKSLTANVNEVLGRFQLDTSYQAYLPCPQSLDFQAEAWGRRIMVAREISTRFDRTFTLLLGSSKNPVPVAQSPLFREFLSSDEFLKPNSSLIHPYGIGCGYENVSKFFFWLIGPGRTFISALVEPAFWNAVFTDFAFHLISTSHHSREEFYQSIDGAIRFPDHTNPEFQIVVSKRQVLKIPSSALIDKSFFNLSTLST